MEIKIDLPDWKCENILIKHGFIVEKVTAFYENSVDPYDNAIRGTLYPIEIRVAYPKYARPTELEKEHPMLEVLNDFAYDKVVNRLFNADLWDVVMKNG